MMMILWVSETFNTEYNVNKQTNKPKEYNISNSVWSWEKNLIQFQSKILNITPTHSSYEMNKVQCRYHDVK